MASSALPPPPPPPNANSPPTPATTTKTTVSINTSTTTNTTSLTSKTGSSSSSAADLDERASAKAALEAAEEILRSLCASHAPTFVAVERRSTALEEALKSLLDKTIVAEDNVSRAKSCLEEEDDNENEEKDHDDVVEDDGNEEADFSSAKKLSELAERHRLRRRTLLQHSSLLELLELPGLMEACVRSGLYDEALSVAGFANALERRHLLSQPEELRGRGKVVAQVVCDVRRREGELRRHLLHRLRGDVTMPQCLEVVTALRRLNGVELERTTSSASTGGGESKNRELERLHKVMELKLQVAFLESRDSWLDAALVLGGSDPAKSSSTASGNSSGNAGGIMGSSSSHSEHILDSIDSYRTRCFEIATQFLAIFRTSNSTSSSLPSSVLPTSSTSTSDQSLSLLSMWTTRRIHTFLSTLTSQIRTLSDTASLRDALDASLFFATSMARMGADFQPLLLPIFEPRLISIVTGYWTDGVNALGDVLKVCRDAGVASPLYSDATTSTTTVANAERSGDDAVSTATTPPPPRILLSLPPLARLLNSYLSGLNELRRCLLPQTFIVLRQHLHSFLEDVQTILSTNERAVLTPGMRGEAMKLREVAKKMREVFLETVKPFCVECLEISFGCIVEKKEEEEIEESKETEEEEEKADETTEDDGNDNGDEAENENKEVAVSENEHQNDDDSKEVPPDEVADASDEHIQRESEE